MKKYKKEDLKNIEKIGVIMFGLLGDVILRTPVLHALKEIYPNAKMVAFVDPIGKAVLENNNDVDEIIVIDRKKEKNKLRQNYKKLQAILALRKEKFDLLVNLYNGGSSRLMVQFSGARYKLGFCMQKNQKIYNIENKCAEDRLKERQSLYNYMISIVEPLSDKKFPLKPLFNLDTESLVKMQNLLDASGYESDKIYLLNMGASKEDKMLTSEKYFLMIRYIYEKYSYIPAIIANPGQEYLQQELITVYLRDNDIPYIKLPTLPLVDIASLIKLTKFIITPDTGLMHLAMAFDNYIMTIFTYTHPIFVDPHNDKFVAVYERFDEDKLYQHQNISTQNIINAIVILFKKLKS
ncbi:glycosyltransferase family 9 protein [Sulfurimonas sp. NWX79]|uniref:glycosyltransferase family 9 protein n=1 Tax=Sulfurimonas sp. NWX79 TaxID=2925412 RepID=UPI003204E5D8